jgi:CheY-like chemotaxis protein
VAGKRILLIDHRPEHMRQPVLRLELEGYDVDEAANGAVALEMVERHPPDVILLDMRMPVLDGWGFAAELRRRGRQIPIVVMTAARDAARWADEIAANGALSKPFAFDDLLRAVREARAA